MKFVEKINRELMDVELPGIFVSNCMASLDEISLKLYIYIKFLAKNRIDFEAVDIAKKFGLKVAELEKALDVLETEELILKYQYQKKELLCLLFSLILKSDFCR